MSFTAALNRRPALNSATYVCRACRHHLLLAQKSAGRCSSTEATPANDNWENNFNDVKGVLPSLERAGQQKETRSSSAPGHAVATSSSTPPSSTTSTSSNGTLSSDAGGRRKRRPRVKLLRSATDKLSSLPVGQGTGTRLPLDPSGRDEQPMFRASIKALTSHNLPDGERLRRISTRAERAQQGKRRPGWGGLIVGSVAAARRPPPAPSDRTLTSGRSASSPTPGLIRKHGPMHIEPSQKTFAPPFDERQEATAAQASNKDSSEKDDRKTPTRKAARAEAKRAASEKIENKSEKKADKKSEKKVEKKVENKAEKKSEKAGNKIEKKVGNKVIARGGPQEADSRKSPVRRRLSNPQKLERHEQADEPLWRVMQEHSSPSEGSFEDSMAAEKSDGRASASADEPPLDASTAHPASIDAIRPADLTITPLDIPQPPVPSLQHGLDRVLFNQGVYQLQDSHSRVYNFDPYLQKVLPVAQFNFNSLKEYKTSSQDEMLSNIAKDHSKKYIGSTSSMTSTLAHFHYLLSDMRNINLEMLSRGFSDQLAFFTKINQAPNAIFLRWKNGTYAIDADKEHDGANVLMLLGKSMEKLLTLPASDFERYRKDHPVGVSDEEKEMAEAFQYTTMGDFLMRSQLDAHDPRLPGTGMFDLKTRSVVSVRMETENFQPMTGYQIHTLQGRYESYEREYYDMMRSTMLKYMLQARMGRMDGIFLAYHNVERIFGFQYLPMSELDRAMHGQVHRCLGDQEFRASLHLLNQVLESATAKFPEQSLRIHFETRAEGGGEDLPSTNMLIFAEPMSDEEIDKIQSTSKGKIAEFEKNIMKVGEGLGAAKPEEDRGEEEFENIIARATAEANADDTQRQDGDDAKGKDSHSSSSAADSKFIKSLNMPEGELKPLYVASLIVKSSVNGEEVTRPRSLTPDDDWEIEYMLQEWEATTNHWARYENMKARRREALSDEPKEEDDLKAGEGTKVKKSDSYIRFLAELSARGREFRNKIDELEKNNVPVVVGVPAAAASAGDELAAAKDTLPADVDDYMSWLYSTGGQQQQQQQP